MALRWYTAGMVEAGNQFRRINGRLRAPWLLHHRRADAREAAFCPKLAGLVYSVPMLRLSGRH